MNCDIIHIIKAFLPTKDLYHLELTSVLYSSTKVPLYQQELRSIYNWPIKNFRYSFVYLNCIEYGKVHALRYLIRRFRPTLDIQVFNMYSPQWSLQWACEFGCLEIVKCIVDTFCLTINDVLFQNSSTLIWTVYHGHLEILKYLVETFKLTVEDFNLSRYATLYYTSKKYHYPIIKYLSETFEFTDQDINILLRAAAINNQTEIVNYITNKYNITFYY